MPRAGELTAAGSRGAGAGAGSQVLLQMLVTDCWWLSWLQLVATNFYVQLRGGGAAHPGFSSCSSCTKPTQPASRRPPATTSWQASKQCPTLQNEPVLQPAACGLLPTARSWRWGCVLLLAFCISVCVSVCASVGPPVSLPVPASCLTLCCRP